MLKLQNCSLTELKLLLKEKIVVAYGAGRYPKEFVKHHADFDLENAIYFFCDSDRAKEGIYFELNGKQIPIISLNAIKQLNYSFVLLITTNYYDTVIHDLDRIKELDGISCYILPLVEKTREHVGRKESEYIKEQFGSQRKIPKIIHYCWFGGNEIPLQQRKFIEGWKKLCPDYEIVCWNEDNYDVSKNKYMYETYKSRKFGFVGDFARIDLLYEWGGVYLDTDVEMVKNIDEFLTLDAFTGFQNSTEINFGQGFGSVAGDTFLKKLKNKYDNLRFINNDGSLNLTPSPVYLTEWFREEGLVINDQYQKIGQWSIFPQEYFSGMLPLLRILDVTDNTYLIHHYEGTWLEKPNRDKIIKLGIKNGKIGQRFYKEGEKNK